MAGNVKEKEFITLILTKRYEFSSLFRRYSIRFRLHNTSCRISIKDIVWLTLAIMDYVSVEFSDLVSKEFSLVSH